ncbi:uncharacterized protein LOC128268409 [Anopheles cruzii]|uniref:uncharacterized protein LOC128268409 n=1 Tax=Anopheles cruzii TaxID=68878 RepID=UPI0022EC2FAA|nr:uncharacterized protein LOC128268409 [Anopheles cruzii]
MGFNLLVSNLHPNITNQQLFNLFAPYGNISSTTVYQTGNSLGHGFVNFYHAQNATRAIVCMNGREIYGFRIYVEPAPQCVGNPTIQPQQQDARSIGLQYINDMIMDNMGFYFNKSKQQPLRQAATSCPGNVGRNIPQIAEPRKTPKTPPKKAQTKCTADAAKENSTVSVAANILHVVDRAEQKRILGECLFTAIKAICPQLADKVTGMLVELNNTDILDMLEHPETLKKKVNAAFAVLQSYYKAQT